MKEVMHECGNCGGLWEDVNIIPLAQVQDLNQRLDPGSDVPSGECKVCGALCYLVEDEKRTVAGVYYQSDGFKAAHAEIRGAIQVAEGKGTVLPDVAGVMLAALQDVSDGYQKMFDVMPVAWQTYDNVVTAALEMVAGAGVALKR